MNKLKHYRQQAGITQAELAERAGVGVRMVQHYEQGSKSLEKTAATTVLHLARALGVTVEDLIGQDNA